jgi:hypothetical protein
MAKDTCFWLASILALPFAVALASGQASAADSKTGAAAELQRARELDSRGDHKKACKAYLHASELAQGQWAPSLIGLSDCYTQSKERDKAIAAARQALAVAATPEERTEATRTLGFDLLRQPDEQERTEALALFKEQAASGGPKAQGELLTALLVLHRDQDAAEILQNLRKQGKSEDDIQQEVLYTVYYRGPADDESRIDDFNEHLQRLDPDSPLRVLSMGLTENAVDAVKAWTFKPAALDGKPVKVWYVLTIHFEIH